MKYKLLLLTSFMLTLSSFIMLAHKPQSCIQRVIHVGNITGKSYKVTVKDAQGKSHESAILTPGATQYMFCRTEKISQIDFEPVHALGHPFNIQKPLTEMFKVRFNDHDALNRNFHFYLLSDNSVKAFPAESEKDKNIIKLVKNHKYQEAEQAGNNKTIAESLLELSF